MWHAYIDESGDRGWKQRSPGTPAGQRSGSSRVFTMSAVLVPDGTQPAVLRTWDAAAAATKRRVVHWQDVKQPGARHYLVNTIASLPDVQTITVALCKWHLPNVNTLTDPGYFYHWTARLMLERLSWFGKAQGDIVYPTFAQVKGHPPRRIVTYFRKLGSMPTDIEWRHLRMPPAFSTPRMRRILQLSDTVSGAVFAAFEPDEWGFTDQTYLRELRGRMWWPIGRKLSGYGLKVGPYPNAACEAEHTWLSDFYQGK